MTGILFGCKVRGAGHTKKDIPCEDAYQTLQSRYGEVFAVSDGHGDMNCPRSSQGSQIACRIACDMLLDFSKTHVSVVSCKPEEIKSLIKRILLCWKYEVHEDLRINPLTQDEEDGCRQYLPLYQEGKFLEHIYGATLIAGVRNKKYLLLIQQGDGRCSVYDEKGSVSQPIPWDSRCFANVTTSLCDEDAEEGFRWILISREEKEPTAVILSSDGLEDSFGYLEEMHSWERSLLVYAAESDREDLEKKLREILPGLSEKGSRDDITVCGYFDPLRIAGLKKQLEAENEKQKTELKLELLKERLVSMEGKMTYLENHMEQAQQKYRKDITQQNLDNVFKAAEELKEYRDKRCEVQTQIGELEKQLDLLTDGGEKDA